MGKSVLTLDTIEPDRDFITIDGKPYSLRIVDELGAAGLSKLKRLSSEVAEKRSSLVEEDAGRVETAANDVLAIIVVDLPDDIRDKLRLSQKTAIVEAFTAVASRKRAEKATEQERESQKTMDGSSPGSSDSTGDPSATG